MIPMDDLLAACIDLILWSTLRRNLACCLGIGHAVTMPVGRKERLACGRSRSLFFLLTSITLILLLSSPSLLPPHTSRAPTTEWRGQSEINMLLGVETNDEGWNVDDLLSDPTRTRSRSGSSLSYRSNQTYRMCLCLIKTLA